MNFKSYMRPVGLASCGALGITVAVLLSLWGAGAEAHKHKAPVMELTPELLKIRDDLAKYKDPFIAVRDGYLSTVACVQYPDGDMGVHFLNMALIGPVPDPAKPPVLMYEPGSDGKLQLIAVEWFIPLATGIKDRPTLFGQDFHGPMAGHEPLIPDGLHHYDLHVGSTRRTRRVSFLAPTLTSIARRARSIRCGRSRRARCRTTERICDRCWR